MELNEDMIILFCDQQTSIELILIVIGSDTDHVQTLLFYVVVIVGDVLV